MGIGTVGHVNAADWSASQHNIYADAQLIAPFDNVKVRKAISMAIDKKAIIDAVYLSSGIAAKNAIPPSRVNCWIPC